MQTTLYQADISDKLERIMNYCLEQYGLETGMQWGMAMDEIHSVMYLVNSSELYWNGSPCEIDLAKLVNAESNRNFPYAKGTKETMELLTYIKPVNGDTIKLYSYVFGQKKTTWYYHGEFSGTTGVAEIIESLRMRREELAR